MQSPNAPQLNSSHPTSGNLTRPGIQLNLCHRAGADVPCELHPRRDELLTQFFLSWLLAIDGTTGRLQATPLPVREGFATSQICLVYFVRSTTPRQSGNPCCRPPAKRRLIVADGEIRAPYTKKGIFAASLSGSDLGNSWAGELLGGMRARYTTVSGQVRQSLRADGSETTSTDSLPVGRRQY